MDALIAPIVLVLSTSFVRIVVVLTCVIMTPTFEAIQRDAIAPYAAGRITQSGFLDRANGPLRA